MSGLVQRLREYKDDRIEQLERENAELRQRGILMSAFIGLNLPKGYPDPKSRKSLVKGPPDFYLSPDFTLANLESLVLLAEQNNDSTLYLPSMERGRSGPPLDTWYARALVNHLKNEL